MSTKREVILQAAISALAGTTGVGARIYRSRVAAFSAAEIPALLVEAVNDVSDLASIGRYSWNFTFNVMVLTRTGEVDASADPIIADVHNKILSDATLLGLVVNIQPVSIEWTLTGEKESTPIGIAAVQFRATYQTEMNSVT